MTMNDIKNPEKRLKKLEKRRDHYWESIFIIVGNIYIVNHEIAELRSRPKQ